MLLQGLRRMKNAADEKSVRIRLIEALSTDLICNTVIFTGIFLKGDQSGGV